MQRILRRLAFASCLVLAFVPRGAGAQAGQVVLVLAERGSAAEALESDLPDALRGELRELAVGVMVVKAAREPLALAAQRAKQIAARERALGVIWLEITALERFSVFLYDAGGHLYARDIELSGSTASQSEALAIILRSAIAAMLEGEAVAMNEIELPQPPAPPKVLPSPPPVAPRRSEPIDERYLRAGAYYVGTAFARRTAWQHGVALVVMARPTAAPWFFGANYTHFSNMDLEADGAQIRLQRHPGEVFGGMDLPLGSLRLNVMGAVSADYLLRKTTAVDQGWEATGDSGRWLWAVSTRLGLALPLARRVSGVLTGGADFLLNPFSQALAPTSSTTEIIETPRRARPRVELGVVVSAW